jgi:hypothetical protein
VVQIWLGLFVCKQVTVCPGRIWTTLYNTLIRPAMLYGSECWTLSECWKNQLGVWKGRS